MLTGCRRKLRKQQQHKIQPPRQLHDFNYHPWSLEILICIKKAVFIDTVNC